MIIMIIFLMMMVILVIWDVIENHMLRTSSYQVWDEMIPHAFDGKKIVYLVDFHNTPYPKFNERIKKRIELFEPDYVFIGGDFLSKRDNSFSYALDLLSFLSERYPIYYSNGNHETKMKEYSAQYNFLYEDFMKMVQTFNITFLNNAHCRIYANNENTGESIVLHGLELDEEYFQKFSKAKLDKQKMNHYLGKCSSKEYHILLAHSPDYFKAYEEWGANLVLSGHNHGGMVRVPFLGGVLSTQAKVFPAYTKGCYRIKKSKMIVSAGLGSHTIKVRFFNPPDLVTLTLYSDKLKSKE